MRPSGPVVRSHQIEDVGDERVLALEGNQGDACEFGLMLGAGVAGDQAGRALLAEVAHRPGAVQGVKAAARQ